VASHLGWFKFWTRAIHDPKIVELDNAEFRFLVTLWCLASESTERGVIRNPSWGHLVHIAAIEPGEGGNVAFDLESLRNTLRNAGLIKVRTNGDIEINHWEEWQAPSDPSNAVRQRRYRALRNGASNALRNGVEVEKDVEKEKDILTPSLPLGIKAPKSVRTEKKRKPPEGTSEDAWTLIAALKAERLALGLAERTLGVGFAQVLTPLIAADGRNGPILVAVAKHIAITERDFGVDPKQMLMGDRPQAVYEGLADAPWTKNGNTQEQPKQDWNEWCEKTYGKTFYDSRDAGWHDAAARYRKEFGIAETS